MVPPLVERALALAESHGFERSCTPEVGRLLHVLAGSRGRERVAEIGTGAGVGAAWIVSALPPQVPFFTTELDEERAAAVAELFADDANVHVLAGDWRELLPAEAPFDLVFFDAAKQLRPRGGRRARHGDARAGRDRGARRPHAGPPARTPCGTFWLGRPELAAVEVLTAPSAAAILGVRR